MQGEGDSGYDMASSCPSFSCYSRDTLAGTAARVCLESPSATDDEFEFVHIRTDQDPTESSGDGGLLFPVFDSGLRSPERNGCGGSDDVAGAVAPLVDLFRREREDPPSSSSSEAGELDEIPSEMYCAWTPGRSAAGMSPSGCQKSKSTGSSSSSSRSSKRWRLKDLLKRSQSDGKQSLVLLKSNSITIRDGEDQNTREEVSAHEKFYLRNKARKEEGKRRSYLPYRQDLVGLFANMNGLGRTFPPF